jgi:2,3-bisphosphoglycerate-independent phosphoglycerate mutase
MNTRIHPVALVILDGFGYRADCTNNGITPTTAPHFFSYWNVAAHAVLIASQEAVGLPAGTNGNSEAGHLAIGTGQLIEQPLKIINNMIADKTFFSNPIMDSALNQLAQTNGSLHIMGILSDGNVHGSIDQLLAFLDLAQKYAIKKIVLHPFLDGRDVDPQSAAQFLKKVDTLRHKNSVIGSIHGRFYAMDRDKNWERTRASYDLLTTQSKPRFDSWVSALDYYYAQTIFDEFVPPTALHADCQIKSGDAIVHTNIRQERSTQLLSLLAHERTENLSPQLLWLLTPVKYDLPLKTIHLLEIPEIKNTLKQQLHDIYKKRIFTIAETEKWSHVTYFFDGFHENLFLEHETRIQIPSIKTKDLVQFPEMSAPAITARVLESLDTDPRDFYLINYANADMLGHTGNQAAIEKAITCLDEQLKILYEAFTINHAGTLIITADHGNAELLCNPITGLAKTAHTMNPVPFVYINQREKKVDLSGLKSLTDIADFIIRQAVINDHGY